MKIKYSELIDQTLYFPQEELKYEDHQLYFHDIPLMDLVEKFGTRLNSVICQRFLTILKEPKVGLKTPSKKRIQKLLPILLLHQI
jgi:arginine decarboxylase